MRPRCSTGCRRNTGRWRRCFYMQEQSYDEVASMLGLPVGTVKTYLFRARKTLAEELARERVRKGRS